MKVTLLKNMFSRLTLFDEDRVKWCVCVHTRQTKKTTKKKSKESFLRMFPLLFSLDVLQVSYVSCLYFCLQVDFSEKPVFWKALKPPAKDKCGELLVSLCYHPTNSTLTLTLLKARNLKAKDINGKSGSWILYALDSTLIYDTPRVLLHLSTFFPIYWAW